MRRRLADVRAAFLDGDQEKAHFLEDGLRIAVLQDIATGEATGSRAVVLAELALSTEGLPIERHCA